MEKRGDGVLEYHYCPFNRFVGIVRSREIRFADLASMDDPNEKRFLWNVYFEVLKERYGTDSGFRDLIRKQDPDGMIQMSFSFTYDGSSAHMWNDYARGGAGVAMGFDKGSVEGWADTILWDSSCEEETAESVPDHDADRTEYPCAAKIAEYGYVEYIKCRAAARNRVRSDIEHEIDEFLKTYGGDYTNLTPGLMRTLERAPFTKTFGYAPEKEYRVIVSLKPGLRLLGHLPVSCRYGPRHRVKKIEWCANSYSPLFPVLFIPFPEGMLRKVRLGPCCDEDVTCVRNFLRNLGYAGVEVEKAGPGELEGKPAGSGERRVRMILRGARG